MANLKQIDIDNSLIIELPIGKKVELATAVAYDNGYTDVIPNSVTIDKVLSVAAAKTLIASLTVEQQLIGNSLNNDSTSVDYGKVSVSYIDETPIANPVTPITFGLDIAQKKLGEIARRAIKNSKLSAINKAHIKTIQDTELALDTSLDAEFNSLTVQ